VRRFALPLAQVSAAAGRAQRPRAPRTNAAAFWCRRRRRVPPRTIAEGRLPGCPLRRLQPPCELPPHRPPAGTPCAAASSPWGRRRRLLALCASGRVPPPPMWRVAGRACPCLRLYGVPSVAGSLVVPATDGEGALRESPGIAEVV